MRKEEILQTLKRDIVTLALKPGTILSETAMSEQFQISRTPLRDVLKQLALEQYMNIYPKKGNVVSYIDLESVEQMIFLRSVLEKEILQSLSGRLPLPGILELRDNLAAQEKAIASADNAHEQFMECDDAFHRTLFQLAGRSYLWNLLQQSNVHYARYRRLHLLKQEKLQDLFQEHCRILEGLIQGDGPHLPELIDRHLREDINSMFLQQNFREFLQPELQ
ncbi:GntR family transcriptional regulator [Paenibacillus sp. YN15]|uniref:GntR family transcriptional regulator n=1 Tax=Paenibacillus sp. YN15 TaxID=1742774 RepID=UPI000DCE380B|nr:GntR family transcriptional regulator [Paenibacillus sp. YN15]RAV02334.1 GntR family transcriptional regulator [Paenibacillus sp. YN15]